MKLENLDPTECFKWFEVIAAIPRCSHYEKQISDHLVSFAKERGLFVAQDALGNVCIKKPASSGMEKAPTVILQGHMDMVCVKEEGSGFDFSRDPITLVVKGDTLTAAGTTLGADNGIALAFIMALLDSKDVPHPALEAVITVAEEVGMTGAAGFDVSQLSGEYFINLDSEEEGVFCVSCAGGRRTEVSLPLATVASGGLPDDLPGGAKRAFFRINVSGLAGGHSGTAIDKERGNANRLMGRILSTLAAKYDCYLAALSGGSASNVIPSESAAVVCINTDKDGLQKELNVLCGVFKNELKAADGEGLALTAQKADAAETLLTRECFSRVVAALLLLPNGVMAMDLNITTQRMVESSANLGVVRMDGGNAIFSSLLRSSVGSKKELMYQQTVAVAECIGATASYVSDYPAWEFSPESKLRDVFKQAYTSLFKKEATVAGIHAGLECGLFFEKFKELGRKVDFIAFGPDITGAHTVNEAVKIRSVANTWNLLRKVLRLLGE
ncbi:Aminoacyl-histidine dipeptidase [uncultured delta proteobacterium]|uniref:Cytosol non-specific dipeptidase n=1 Tax=uncultured delta proteobacterium TaxID=34034 RepID=A0A212J5D3_9DELT|nr:Aminoacyl-histidine dipeptidase [uncultured delta proteobacterium]